jgi:hypothetical protein
LRRNRKLAAGRATTFAQLTPCGPGSYVVVEFTIAKSGETSELKVVESAPTAIFDRGAIQWPPRISGVSSLGLASLPFVPPAPDILDATPG